MSVFIDGIRLPSQRLSSAVKPGTKIVEEPKPSSQGPKGCPAPLSLEPISELEAEDYNLVPKVVQRR